MEIKQAYPTPPYRDQQNRTKTMTSDSVSGVNNFELCCYSIAGGVIRLYNKNDEIDLIAIQIVNQAMAIIKEIEKREFN